MKSVLISIQPKWCELIANGKKTIEVRKTKPKLDTPFKVYIYCSGKDYDKVFYIDKFMHKVFLNGNGKQKVIGEFVCDEIFEIKYQCGSYRCKGLTVLENDRVASDSKLSLYDMRSYLSCNNGYGWHISNLVIYDKPKELSEFYKEEYCYPCVKPIKRPITRPPQSWCYVESLGDTQ